MLTWVMYDVSKTKNRNKVVKACQQIGIYRVQYSVWLGDINKTQRKELACQIKEIIDGETDRVYVFPMCREDFDQCELMGQAFDKELICDELKALLF